MALNDVKEITIPEGSVKKIEDSNGNIIWGSQSAFPYRRLEYIHFGGTEYLDTGLTPIVGYYYLNAKIPPKTDTWSILYGAGHTISGTAFRFFFQSGVDNNGTISYRLKDLTAGNMSMTTYQNNVIQLKVRNYFTNNTYGRYWWASKNLGNDSLSDGDNYSNIIGQYYNNTTYACNFNNFNTTIAIGAYHYNGSWTSTGNRATMDVYRHFVRADSDGSAITHNQFPCQRKSDGVCGLYDTITSTFIPMQGTNITNAAAGPVADEYWDLTAPA